MTKDDIYRMLAIELREIDGWNKMSAAERTVACCIRLAENGQELPSVQTIRHIIGKGDARSILAGREKAVQRLGERLRFFRASELNDKSSAEVMQHAMSIWQAGVEHGQQEAARQIEALQQQIEQLQGWVALYRAEKADHES